MIRFRREPPDFLKARLHRVGIAYGQLHRQPPFLGGHGRWLHY